MLALRPQLVGVGPLLPRIQDDLAVSHAVAGALTTIPVLCMGVFAPLGPWLAGRLGTRTALAVCLVLLAVSGVVRPYAPGVALVLGMTFVLGIWMGAAGPLPAVIVRQHASRAPGRATGIYSLGIVAGSALIAAAAVPLADALGGWREALAVTAVVGVGSLVALLVLVPPDRSLADARPRRRALPWRSPTAWLLIAVFGLQAIVYYGVISWVPDVYVERGWDERQAADLIALLHLFGLAAGVAVPWLVDRVGTRRMQVAGVATIMVLALVGLIALPDLAFLWAAGLGVSLGSVFPLVLLLPVDVADQPGDVGAMAAAMLVGGYAFSALGPVGLGAVRDLTGDYGASLWALVALAVGLLLATRLLSAGRLRRREGTA
jgi:CP family cyanate transporter-like MFS transporter